MKARIFGLLQVRIVQSAPISCVQVSCRRGNPVLCLHVCVVFARQCGSAQGEGGCGARAGEADRPEAQGVLWIRREVWSGEGSNGQGSSWHPFNRGRWTLPLISSAFWLFQVALGNDYVAQVDKHSSQKDASKGFGGKFGVEKDRIDKVGSQDKGKQLQFWQCGKSGVSKTVFLCL